MRVLLIEPDAGVAKAIELMLRSEGIKVYATDLGEEGADLAKVYDYDVVLLEPRLPDLNGLDVLRQLRAAKIASPVIFLSGVSDVETKVRCFAAGADDYLTKPFHRDELLARIGAVVRRSKGHPESKITVGPITVDVASKQVRVGDVYVHLTGKEYQMLELLSLRKGTTLTKEMFLNHLYGGMDEPELKIIDVFICKLRNKLRAFGAHRHLETVWGRGYRLVETPEEKLAEVSYRGRKPVQDAVREALAAGGQRLDAIRRALPWAQEQAIRNALQTLCDRGVLERRGPAGAATYRLKVAGVAA